MRGKALSALPFEYSEPPQGRVDRGELKEAVLGRANAYIRLRRGGDVRLGDWSAAGDRYGHWLLRLACAMYVPDSLDDFVAYETALYKKRLEVGSPLRYSSDQTIARMLGAKAVIPDRRAKECRNYFRDDQIIYAQPVFAKYRRRGQLLTEHSKNGLKRSVISGIALERLQAAYQADCEGLMRRGILVRGEFFFPQNLLVDMAVNRLRWRLQDEVHKVLLHKLPLRLLEQIREYEKVVKRAFFCKGVSVVDRTKVSAAQFDDDVFPRRIGKQGPTRLPPCMARMHLGLRTTHHLHHHARIQLTFFLRQFMDPDQGLRFFYEEFKHRGPYRKRTWATYEKQLNAIFSKKDLSSFGCFKLQTDRQPNRHLDQFDGCPFRFDDRADLEDLLRKMGAPHPTSILDDLPPDPLDPSPYRRQCASAFKAIHGIIPDSDERRRRKRDASATAPDSPTTAAARKKQKMKKKKIHLAYDEDDVSDDDGFGGRRRAHGTDDDDKQDPSLFFNKVMAMKAIESPVHWFRLSWRLLPREDTVDRHRDD